MATDGHYYFIPGWESAGLVCLDAATLRFISIAGVITLSLVGVDPTPLMDDTQFRNPVGGTCTCEYNGQPYVCPVAFSLDGTPARIKYALLLPVVVPSWVDPLEAGFGLIVQKSELTNVVPAGALGP